MQRIGSGSMRGRKLAPLPRGVYVRPTLAKVRGAICDRLQLKIPDSRILDLYAGSGAMSFEMVSRGARHATLVERDPRLQRRLAAEIRRLELGPRCALVRAEVGRFVSGGMAAQGPFDVVIIDPPFADAADLGPVAEGLLNAGMLAPEAVVVTQRPIARGEATPVDWPAKLDPEARRVYGQSQIDFHRFWG